jgi:hypothetical protein
MATDIIIGPPASGSSTGDTLVWNALTGLWEIHADDGEIHLTPKASSTGAIGTVYFSSDDEHLWVGVTA